MGVVGVMGAMGVTTASSVLQCWPWVCQQHHNISLGLFWC